MVAFEPKNVVLRAYSGQPLNDAYLCGLQPVGK